MKRKVVLNETTTSMDQDLVMYIKVDRLHEGTLILEVRILEIIERKFISFITVPFFFYLQKSAKWSSALMLSILPKFEQKEHKAELIFVIDRSGSMGGDGIKQAKKALLVIIPV